MNLTICLSAAFLILSHAAFCMPIRGQVKAGNKGAKYSFVKVINLQLTRE